VIDTEARFLDALYRGVADDGELKQALRHAQDIFDCSAGALLWINAQTPEINFAVISGVFDEHGRLYLEQFAPIDPAPAIFSRLSAGTASSTDRIMTPEQRATDPFYNEYFRPIGLVETLGGTLFSDRARFSLIGLQRGPDRPQFDDDDIGRLERLMPHVARALQLRREFLRTSANSHGLQFALDRMPAGLIIYQAGNGVLFVNTAMRAMAQQADGLSLDRGGRLLPANQVSRRRIDALLNGIAKGGAGGIASVPRSSGLRDYVVLVAPCPPPLGEQIWDRRGQAGAIVLVHDPSSRPLGAPEILEQALHLPKGAARLVAALAADDDLKSFAEREGVTIHTARFHLRTALTRTGDYVRLLRDLSLRQNDR
jgi:PAS domain-containing protein